MKNAFVEIVPAIPVRGATPICGSATGRLMSGQELRDYERRMLALIGETKRILDRPDKKFPSSATATPVMNVTTTTPTEKLGQQMIDAGMVRRAHAPASPHNPSPAPASTDISPEAQAKLEWDNDPLLKWQNFGDEKMRNWLAYRVAELKGLINVPKEKRMGRFNQCDFVKAK